VHAFVPMPVGDRCAECLMPASHPIRAQGTPAQFKARFDHLPQVLVSSRDARRHPERTSAGSCTG
jgi:hypothetical protein